MGMLVERGAKRTAKPDIFISHSSQDKPSATRLATTLNFCAIDVWLDDWELEVGQSLLDEIAKAMEGSKFIAILITENYNETVWTKREYKTALAREQREQRTVMLPLIVGEAKIPQFLEDKKYIDLRKEYFSGIVDLVGMVHNLSRYRVSKALREHRPESVRRVWQLLRSIGFEPYVVLGADDFSEVLQHGGQRMPKKDERDPEFLKFDPEALLQSSAVSYHIKELVRELELF